MHSYGKLKVNYFFKINIVNRLNINFTIFLSYILKPLYSIIRSHDPINCLGFDKETLQKLFIFGFE